MKIGTTSFGFRYLMLDAALAPPLESIVEQAASARLQVLQVCENARPMALSEEQWRALVCYGERLGVEIQLGCKTLSPAVIAGHLERARELPGRMLRAVLEEEGGEPPNRDRIDALLAGIWPAIERTGVRLAIENHFDIPSRVLAAAVEPYPKSAIGFCVDTANSLRNFESPDEVLDRLGNRAFCYHVKDFKVEGHLLGFAVSGAPLGSGGLDLDRTLDRIFAHDSDPEILIENWVPPTGSRDRDIREDQRWLTASLTELRRRLDGRGAEA